MKYLFFLLFICTSCGPETMMFKRTYSIKNESDTQVTLNFYRANGDQVESKILNNNQVFVGFEVETTNENSFLDPESSVLSSSYSGSIKLDVIYNNSFISTKEILDDKNGGTSFSLPLDRNVFRNGNYIPTGNEVYQFTITQQDFDNATPCDGPCE